MAKQKQISTILKAARNYIVRNKNGYFLALLLMSVINLLFMHYQIMLTCTLEFVIDTTSFFDNFLGCFFDASFIFCILLLLTVGRVKKSLLVTFIITLLWSFCNVFYSRFFYQYISISAIGQAGNMFNKAVFDSMLVGFEFYDLYYLLASILFIWLYEKNSLQTKAKDSLRNIFVSMVLTGIVVFMSHIVYVCVNPEFRYFSCLVNRLGRYTEPKKTYTVYPNWMTFHRGFFWTTLINNKLFSSTLTLDEEQIASIEKKYKDHTQRRTNHHKQTNIENVIFIFVESYLSVTSDLIINNQEITPNLNSLKRDSNVYYNGHLKPNISVGESSDGQFIYMTGLLPLHSEITVSYAKNCSLIGLPELLKSSGYIQKSKIIVPTAPSFWEQNSMNLVYGIDSLYSNADYTGPEGIGRDGNLSDDQLFLYAQTTDHLFSNHFFSAILTMSMHQPYSSCIDTTFHINDDSLPNEYKNYLIACHFFDTQVGNYLSYLKDCGLYDKSLIVITADHDAHIKSLKMEGKISNSLPLYIVNGNIDNTTAWQGECNQLDVYTTLLDILGIDSDWRGLGHTLLQRDYHNSVSTETRSISEQIIYSNYFEKYY